ncbi:hypothetical protein BDV93DRAFT_586962, partial [Ceratobasidium sp. AG-I]
MSPHALRLFYGLIPLVTLLVQQALPAAALVLQERQSQEPTLPSNLTQDVLQVASAISPPCANIESCISLVTGVIPNCTAQGGDPGCWCANHDALHYCAMCMISPVDNQTTACNNTINVMNELECASNRTFYTANQTEEAAAGHSDPEIWNTKNIRPDGTTLIVHSSKDLVSGQAEKVAFTWSFGPFVVCITAIRVVIVKIGPLSWQISGTIGVKIPFIGLRTLASFSG